MEWKEYVEAAKKTVFAKVMYERRMGTKAEYDKLDKELAEMGAELFYKKGYKPSEAEVTEMESERNKAWEAAWSVK